MLLVNPANAEYGGSLSRFTPLSLPMSIGCLAAVMLEKGHPVRIVDEELGKLNEENLAEQLQGLPSPYIFGVSVLTGQAARGYELARLFKAQYPDCKVILGGFHPTAVPEEALCVPEVDAVVRGEGERTLLTLYDVLRAGSDDFSEIPGVSWRREGAVIHNPDAPLIADIDSLPMFPYHLFVEMLEQKRSQVSYDWGFILTSRGCPYRCNYCAIRMMTGNTYRFRSPEKIVAELDVLINQLGATNIFFMDDNFCFKKARTREVCQAITQSRLGEKCTFSLQTRADNFYEDVVPMMKEAGFKSVGFGMETGSDRLALLIQKGETVAQHEKAVAVAKKHGMDVALYMIFGLPTETHADRVETVRVVRRMNPTHIKYNNLIPYPGTPFYTDMKSDPRFNKEGIWSNFTSSLTEMGNFITNRKPLPYVPDGSSEYELMRDVIRYNLLAVLSPRVLLAVLGRKHGPGWFKLKPRWFVYPAEWAHVLRLALVLAGNLLVSLLPLTPLESIMEWINPRLQKRTPTAQLRDYVPSGWAKDSFKKEMSPMSEKRPVLASAAD